MIGRWAHGWNDLGNESLANGIGEKIGVRTTVHDQAFVWKDALGHEIVGKYLLVRGQITDQLPGQILIVGLGRHAQIMYIGAGHRTTLIRSNWRSSNTPVLVDIGNRLIHTRIVALQNAGKIGTI